jgi:hypothetical protein
MNSSTYFCQMTITPEEVRHLENLGTDIETIFSEIIKPRDATVVDVIDREWIEFSSDDLDNLRAVELVFRERLDQLATTPTIYKCPSKCIGSCARLVVYTIYTRIFEQNTTSGHWVLTREIEHQENPVHNLECSYCGASLEEPPRGLDVQKVLASVPKQGTE